MNILSQLKQITISLLESHPIGYIFGLKLLECGDFLLPHEFDYYGFEILVNNGYTNNKLILDLGANRGHSARGFMKILPDWNVFSVEANSLHINALEKTKQASKNRMDYKIAAAGDITGQTIELFTPIYKNIFLHSATSTSYDEAKNAVMEAFPHSYGAIGVVKSISNTIALDDLNLKPGFIKLDIQGAENAAITGLKKTLTMHQPILLVEQNSLSVETNMMLSLLGYEPWSFIANSKTFKRGLQGALKGHKNIFYSQQHHEKFFNLK